MLVDDGDDLVPFQHTKVSRSTVPALRRLISGTPRSTGDRGRLLIRRAVRASGGRVLAY
jgi:hypothetical protein